MGRAISQVGWYAKRVCNSATPTGGTAMDTLEVVLVAARGCWNRTNILMLYAGLGEAIPVRFE